MNAWTQYNICMEIAARCNKVFSKNFTFLVTKQMGLWIDAIPCHNQAQAPYQIHMVLSPNNAFEVYFNVDTQAEGGDWIEACFEDLEDIAYGLGYNIVEKYAIKKNCIVFFFNDFLSYPQYENRYDFIVNGEAKHLNTDYPLIHHMKTEFATEFLLYNEMELPYAISSLRKNGKPIFDINVFKTNSLWTIIKIEKNGNSFEVTLQDNNFFSESLCLMKAMSYIGQYASMEQIPTETAGIQRPCIEFYLSSDGLIDSYDVRVERIRNYGFTPQDLADAIPAICAKVNCNDQLVKHWAVIPIL